MAPSTIPDSGAVTASGTADSLGFCGLDFDELDFNDLDVGLWEASTELLSATLPDFLSIALEVSLEVLAAGGRAGTFDPLRAGFAAAAFLAAVLGDVLGDVLADVLEDALEAVLGDVLGDSLEDFLRVFLDIRLPFVAFGGSTNRVLRVSSRPIGFATAAGQV